MPRQSHQPGQTLIEMTLVLPILLMLVMGLFSVGQLLLTHYAVNQAARVAAHQAALTGGDRLATEMAARQSLSDSLGIDPTSSEVVITCARRPCRRYDPITVEVRYHAPLWVPTVLLPFGNEIVVRASATRAAERDQQ